MKCSQVQKHLSDYLAENLRETRSDRVGEHLRGCPNCRRLAEQMRNMIQTLNQIPPVTAPENFLDRVRSARKKMPPKGFLSLLLQKLFLPMKIKVPAQILASAVIAVIIFHVVSTEEMKNSGMPSKQGRPASSESMAPKPVVPELDRRIPMPQEELKESKPVGETRHADDSFPRTKMERKQKPFPVKTVHLTLTLTPKSEKEQASHRETFLDAKNDNFFQTPDRKKSAPTPESKSGMRQSVPKETEALRDKSSSHDTALTMSHKEKSLGLQKPGEPSPPMLPERSKKTSVPDNLEQVAALIDNHEGEVLSYRQVNSGRFQIQFRLPTRQIAPLLERFASLGTLEHSLEETIPRNHADDAVVVLTIKEER